MARYLAQRVLPTHSLVPQAWPGTSELNMCTLMVMSSSSAKRTRGFDRGRRIVIDCGWMFVCVDTSTWATIGPLVLR